METIVFFNFEQSALAITIHNKSFKEPMLKQFKMYIRVYMFRNILTCHMVQRNNNELL